MVETGEREMSSKCAIAVFVKTPGLSPVKTRLAKTIGKDKALEFYMLCLEAVQETLGAFGCSPVWAVGEKEGLNYVRWKDWERAYTGDGNLGKRQNHIYSTLRQNHEKVMLLGTDSPQLTPVHLEEAFAQLETHDFVIGPAHDGGYNFLAGQKDIGLGVWEGVTFSAVTTCGDLCAKLPGTVFRMSPHTDVDEFEDLKTLLNEMPENPGAAQQKIIEWVKETLSLHAA